MKKISMTIPALLVAVAAHTVAAEAADGSIEARAKAAIERGLDWMLAQQQTNGVWSSAQNPALTAMPAWALSASGRPQDLKAIEKAVAFIKGCAQPDGGIYVVVPGRRGGAGRSP